MRIFIVSVFLMVLTGSVLAQDESPSPQITLDNPHIQIMNDKAKELAKNLTKDEAKSLGHIRENFGVLRSIDVARKSVEDAVLLCSENNPTLKDNIIKRHKKWHDNLGTVLDKQEISLKGSINKERFQSPEQVQGYLDTIDDAAKYVDAKLEKKVVTTMEACEKLMKSMDNTQSVILDLLTEMSWPSDDNVIDDKSGEDVP